MMVQSLQSELLGLIEEAIEASPESGGLWMMRFDALKSMGALAEFASCVVHALESPAVSRQLNWIELRSMWEEMAPDEPFPDATTELPASVTDHKPAGKGLEPPLVLPDRRGVQRKVPPPLRRFRDLAQYIAGEELEALSMAFSAISSNPKFLTGYAEKATELLARPTPLELSTRLSVEAGEGRRVFLKRDDLRRVSVEAEHAVAQCYIGSLLGKDAVVTGADVEVHAIEVARAAPQFGMRCVVIVGPQDSSNKSGFVKELTALGATVEPVPEKGMMGTDPREGAVLYWKAATEHTHLVLSLGMAPQPHATMATAFQSQLGRETVSQFEGIAGGTVRPLTVVAAVGSEADSIGFVLPFLLRRDVRVVYAEPEPGGPESWRPGRRFVPYNGQIREHLWLKGVGRIQYVSIADAEAASWQGQLASEGIDVGIEDARAVGAAMSLAGNAPGSLDFLVLVG